MKVRILKHIFDAHMAWRLKELTAPLYPIMVDYPIAPAPRWGYGKPAHSTLMEIVEEHRVSYEALLKDFEAYVEPLARITMEPDSTDARAPHWKNIYFTGLDAVALYCLLAMKRPPLVIEVGSGNSTRFARRAIADHKLPTRIVSLDPNPRSDIDAICDEVIRTPLESADLHVFDRVQSGDFVFVDNSHCSFTNSDVTTFFMDVLPSLPAGVVVHVHDIFIPRDYPPQWSNRFYSEQYLLAAYLLGARKGRMPRILLPNAFVCSDESLRFKARSLWQGTGAGSMDWFRSGDVRGWEGHSFWREGWEGCSFWFEVP